MQSLGQESKKFPKDLFTLSKEKRGLVAPTPPEMPAKGTLDDVWERNLIAQGIRPLLKKLFPQMPNLAAEDFINDRQAFFDSVERYTHEAEVAMNALQKATSDDNWCNNLDAIINSAIPLEPKSDAGGNSAFMRLPEQTKELIHNEQLRTIEQQTQSNRYREGQGEALSDVDELTDYTLYTWIRHLGFDAGMMRNLVSSGDEEVDKINKKQIKKDIKNIILLEQLKLLVEQVSDDILTLENDYDNAREERLPSSNSGDREDHSVSPFRRRLNKKLIQYNNAKLNYDETIEFGDDEKELEESIKRLVSVNMPQLTTITNQFETLKIDSWRVLDSLKRQILKEKEKLGKHFVFGEIPPVTHNVDIVDTLKTRLFESEDDSGRYLDMIYSKDRLQILYYLRQLDEKQAQSIIFQDANARHADTDNVSKLYTIIRSVYFIPLTKYSDVFTSQQIEDFAKMFPTPLVKYYFEVMRSQSPDAFGQTAHKTLCDDRVDLLTFMGLSFGDQYKQSINRTFNGHYENELQEIVRHAFKNGVSDEESNNLIHGSDYNKGKLSLLEKKVLVSKIEQFLKNDDGIHMLSIIKKYFNFDIVSEFMGQDDEQVTIWLSGQQDRMLKTYITTLEILAPGQLGLRKANSIITFLSQRIGLPQELIFDFVRMLPKNEQESAGIIRVIESELFKSLTSQDSIKTFFSTADTLNIPRFFSGALFEKNKKDILLHLCSNIRDGQSYNPEILQYLEGREKGFIKSQAKNLSFTETLTFLPQLHDSLKLGFDDLKLDISDQQLADTTRKERNYDTLAILLGGAIDNDSVHYGAYRELLKSFSPHDIADNLKVILNDIESPKRAISATDLTKFLMLLEQAYNFTELIEPLGQTSQINDDNQGTLEGVQTIKRKPAFENYRAALSNPNIKNRPFIQDCIFEPNKEKRRNNIALQGYILSSKSPAEKAVLSYICSTSPRISKVQAEKNRQAINNSITLNDAYNNTGEQILSDRFLDTLYENLKCLHNITLLASKIKNQGIQDSYLELELASVGLHFNVSDSQPASQESLVKLLYKTYNSFQSTQERLDFGYKIEPFVSAEYVEQDDVDLIDDDQLGFDMLVKLYLAKNFELISDELNKRFEVILQELFTDEQIEVVKSLEPDVFSNFITLIQYYGITKKANNFTSNTEQIITSIMNQIINNGSLTEDDIKSLRLRMALDFNKRWKVQNKESWFATIRSKNPNFDYNKLRNSFVYRDPKSEIVFEVEPNPTEYFNMSKGLHTPSCLNPRGSNNYKLIAHVLDLNSALVWVKENDETIGRIVISISEEGIGVPRIYWYKPVADENRFNQQKNIFAQKYKEYLGLEQSSSSSLKNGGTQNIGGITKWVDSAVVI